MEIRPIKEGEVDAVLDLMEVAFLNDFGDDRRRHFSRVMERDRTLGAFDDRELVGTISAFSFTLTVPGQRTVPMAGTTIVTVRPTHRRRGILRHMMAAHLEDVRRHGEPLAGLWASEATIYGRFGYGCAVDQVSLRMMTSRGGIDGPANDQLRVHMVERQAFEEVAPWLYDAARPLQPGSLSRTAAWWQSRRFVDHHVPGRRGASSFRYVLVKRGAQPVGYVCYRTTDKRCDGLPVGEVDVVELLALDLDAELALWRFLFSIDLTTQVKAGFRRMEDPILERLIDRRACQIVINDGVYLRLIDVAKALSGRGYAVAGVLKIEITDPSDIAGLYRLEVESGGGASCCRCDGPADLRLDAKTLGSAYLGGHRIRALAGAGHVVGSEDAIRLADAMFTGERAPIAREIF